MCVQVSRVRARSVTFNLYGPSATAVCTTPIFTNIKSVTANGDVSSDPAPVTTAGSYYWTATFSGDANNEPKATSCGDSGETSTVKIGRASCRDRAKNGEAGGTFS